LIIREEVFRLLFKFYEAGPAIVDFDPRYDDHFFDIIDRYQVDPVFIATLPVRADPVVIPAGGIQFVKEPLQYSA
jgi:hypothetical protein